MSLEVVIIIFVGICCFGIVYLASSAAQMRELAEKSEATPEQASNFIEFCFVLGCSLALMGAFAMIIRSSLTSCI